MPTLPASLVVPRSPKYLWLLLLTMAVWGGCKKDEEGAPISIPAPTGGTCVGCAYTITRTIGTDEARMEAVIAKPQNDTLDVLLLFHGTVQYDSLVLEAAQNALDGFSAILDREDMLLVSVAYPEEGLLFGDNIQHAEASLRWVQESASQELGITINKVFLAGHSQGGYLVSRLNTMYTVDGVIANGPGPLNLVFRCGLEEIGQLPTGITCSLLSGEYGSTQENPDAYAQRSLLNFTSAHRSKILFVQGLQDSNIQMYSWPTFREQMESCTDCAERIFLEIPGQGHQALFNSPAAKVAFNAFIGL